MDESVTQTSKCLRPVTDYETLPVTTLADGQELLIPVHRLRGASDGPRLGLVALLHGDETLPNEIIRQVLQSVDPADLSGQLVALPASHGLALEALTRNSPIDMLDLNRSFPGDPGGWITEQIAHTISSFLLHEVDALIDLHSGGIFATVDYVYMTAEARGFALALGCEHNFLTAAPHPGGLLGVTAEAGIPAVILELGGGYGAEEHLLAKGVRAIQNAMGHLSMLPGEREAVTAQVVFSELATLRPRVGGMLYPEVRIDRLGEIAVRDELLGRVVSPLTYDVLEEFRCPFEQGRILLLRPALARVNPGEFAYMIGDVATEEPA